MAPALRPIRGFVANPYPAPCRPLPSPRSSPTASGAGPPATRVASGRLRQRGCLVCALKAGDETILVDPLLPPEPDPVLDLIERELGERLAILITVPYHVRSSEQIRRPLPGRRRDHASGVTGPAASGSPRTPASTPSSRATRCRAACRAHRIGKPRRYETPSCCPSHRALVFGDAVAEVDGELRVWAEERVDADVARFYRERFNPTLEPLLELDIDRVLVTHGRAGDARRPAGAGGGAARPALEPARLGAPPGGGRPAEPFSREAGAQTRREPSGSPLRAGHRGGARPRRPYDPVASIYAQAHLMYRNTQRPPPSDPLAVYGRRVPRLRRIPAIGGCSMPWPPSACGHGLRA